VSLATRLGEHWYRPHLSLLTAALTPLAALFGALVALRRALYRLGWVSAARLPLPVVVVGNVTVGGTGKTPLVRALCDALEARGWHPGIVSRGYGRHTSDVREVCRGDDPAAVGDEPLLLATGGAPVVVGIDRAAAARHLLARHPGIDVIVADDGLQHYALARDVEIVVVDASRRFGNGWLLPAGPLREPVRRALAADACVVTGGAPGAAATEQPPHFQMSLEPLAWQPLRDGVAAPDFATLPPDTVHAIAGIAHPERFFRQLRDDGVVARTHAFADHHAFAPADVAFPGAQAILMTEKDAVKCRAFADARMFYRPVRAILDPALVTLVEDMLNGSQAARAPGLPRHEGSAGV
jgi:tetraacyldisaccharide 4'-kinase